MAIKVIAQRREVKLGKNPDKISRSLDYARDDKCWDDSNQQKNGAHHCAPFT